MKRIVVTFAPNGNTKIEAFEFSGGACLAATKDIEEAIGKVQERKSKVGLLERVQEQTIKQ